MAKRAKKEKVVPKVPKPQSDPINDEIQFHLDAMRYNGVKYVPPTPEKGENSRLVYFNMPNFDSSRVNRGLIDETYQGKTVPPAQGINTCPKCGSFNVKTVGSYTRSLDEAGVANNICNACGNKFGAD
jgi:DNA-directed RNA polymerase subunit M/transcription elongation factor TFIIS